MDRKIRVGITHGDVNGVGYEIILKAIGSEGICDLFTPVLFGVPELFEKAKIDFEFPNIKFNVVKEVSEIKDGKINIIPTNVKPQLMPGDVRKDAGEAAVEALEMGVKSLKDEDIDVLVTAPISKEAVQSDSFKFPGHTEFLTERLGEGKEAQMILCNDTLRVALLTKHIPVSQISQNITKERVKESVEDFAETLKKDFGIVRPKIAVLSLNPHAGDGGLLGTEENEILKPALEELRQEGLLSFGPFPADGFFGHGSYHNFDGVLAMYHDQGLAPFKTIASAGGVNFSAGLPYIRTSPDHGTAYDIAWKGEADASSMRDAIYMAIDIFRRRTNYEEATANPLSKYVHEKPERNERFEKPFNKPEQNHESND